MKRIAITGGNGFLGWHTRVALLEAGSHVEAIPLGKAFSLEQATAAVSGADLVIHIAGVNRSSDEEVFTGNVLFANQLALAIGNAKTPPRMLSYANSIQIDAGGIYGDSKRQGGIVLDRICQELEIKFRNIILPNIFGEHGKPFYNSVTATFCKQLVNGEEPVIENDKKLVLMHAQNAADLLIAKIPLDAQQNLQVNETVSGLRERLNIIARVYSLGIIPDLSNEFDRDLFNTYRSYSFENRQIIKLNRHADIRGSFFEVVKAQGGSSQTSFSTTKTDISRGDHFHRRKVERFTVLAGKGIISMRKLFESQVHEFPVSGEQPVAIDMPTGWTHKITNVSKEVLYTSFWSNDIFDPSNPDTVSEKV